MLNLRTYFKVIFDDEKLSDDNLRRFTEDHLGRLAANNDTGAYTVMLTATQGAHDAYFGAIADEDTRAAVRKSLTAAMNAVFEDFKVQVRRREGRVRDAFGPATPAYLEFFPRGLNEYGEATLSTVETLMTRLVDAARRHLADLGQPFLDQFTALKSNFSVARQAQVQKKGEVSEGKTGTAGARDALELQLMDNLLVLAREFKGRPEEGMRFFDQSLIRRGGGSGEPSPAPAPAPGA